MQPPYSGPTPSRGQVPGEGQQSVVSGEDEADRLPTCSHLISSRGQVPGRGQQSAVSGEDEACWLQRSPPTPSRGQVPGGGQQSAVNGEDDWDIL